MIKLHRGLPTYVAASLCAVAGAALAQPQSTPSTSQEEVQTEQGSRQHGEVRGEHESEGAHPIAKTGSLTDKSFVERAAQANMLEIQAAKLAQQQSQGADVRAFSQQMQKDHGMALSQLKSIAQNQGVQLPTQLDAEHQQKLGKLQGKSGAEFDQAFWQLMGQSHEEAVALFQQASQSQELGQELQSFASETLPTLKSHDRLASDMREGKTTRTAEAPSDAAPTRQPQQKRQPQQGQQPQQ